jgi:hypothetical protein
MQVKGGNDAGDKGNNNYPATVGGDLVPPN